jgi:hypothetical protein
VRYWATREGVARWVQGLAHITTRWAIKVLFVDSEELLGLG